jgi:hypothetical protein
MEDQIWGDNHFFCQNKTIKAVKPPVVESAFRYGTFLRFPFWRIT